MGWVVEDKSRAVAGAVDDEGDSEEVVAVDKGHGHGVPRRIQGMVGAGASGSLAVVQPRMPMGLDMSLSL
jgi:hypothetical protein